MHHMMPTAAGFVNGESPPADCCTADQVCVQIAGRLADEESARAEDCAWEAIEHVDAAVRALATLRVVTAGRRVRRALWAAVRASYHRHAADEASRAVQTWTGEVVG